MGPVHTRLNWILSLLLAFGPASLRLVHATTSHHEEAPTAQHEAVGHHHDGETDSAPNHEHHCGICDELACLSPDLPVPPTVPAIAPRPIATLQCAKAVAPAVAFLAPRICRPQPPPRG